MPDLALPDEIVQWIRQQNWGKHHLKWHTTRQWDRLDPASRDWAVRQGWRRAAHQEGADENGFDFLMMHRAMVELLRAQFPGQSALFEGWKTPPVKPDDPNDPLPNGASTPMPKVYVDAIKKLDKTPEAFASQDELGRFIETRARPTPPDPFATSTDKGSGIHNFLHNRFSDDSSPIDLGNPLVNLENARFWRLHGWIDGRWSAYRKAKGLLDIDPTYQARLADEKMHMTAHVAHHAMSSAGPALAGSEPVPATILHPFRESPAAQFQRLMSAPRIGTPDDLRDFLQGALRLELFTIPLYLAAWWSIRPGKAPKPAGELRTVALQEMLHMGLACNLLVAVGGKPTVNGAGVAPLYPDVIPGIIDSAVYSIEALSRPQLKKFLAIEMPQGGAIPPDAVAGPSLGPVAKTIGDFYDMISEALVRLGPQISNNGALVAAGQRAADLGEAGSLFVIRQIGDPANPAPDSALYAIKLIKEQGEGTDKTRGAVDFDGELAHFYRFQQIDLGIRFDRQADGKFAPVPDPSYQVPPADAIFPMAQVPPGGYPGVAAVDDFDRAYSGMLDKLQEAWAKDSDDALSDAISLMFTLGGKARKAMGQGTYGPDFRYLPPPPAAAGAGAALAAAPAPPAIPAVPGYARIKQILDDAVQGNAIGGHGPFWRTLTRDQFVAKSVFGRKLIAVEADGSFDPDASNLVKALEGRPPFGSDLNPPPPGAMIERMPVGFPTVPDDRIQEIRAWITAGCPAQPVAAGGLPPLVDETGGGPADPAQHIAFWHDFDNWAMFQASDEVREDINTFFGVADAWFAAARDAIQLPAWDAAVADPAVRAAIGRLEARQRQTVIAHYGQPVPLLTLLDSFERFGNGSLPPDADRSQDPQHQMNGAIMWFYWSTFVDACLRIKPADANPIPADFWRAMARGVMLGLLNDGIFRANRYTVKGFTADDAGKQKMRDYVRKTAPDTLPNELARRFSESGLGA
ncbi:MAG: ferritin-like domain-containing protein [Isosphaeraceae bacterium]